MAKPKGGLGRGLSALLPDYEEYIEKQSEKAGETVRELNIDDVMPNPDQPRKHFDEDKLTDLAESIKENGVLQPILVVARENDKYMIVAGERRWRASKLAGKETIPALVRNADLQQVLELALIENVQRDDLSPVEEARAYATLMEMFDYTQEKLAQRMGKSRSAIANSTRLLDLPSEVLEMVEEGKLTVGHVRPLLSINVPEWQIIFAHEIYQSNRTVREVEKLVQDALEAGYVTTESKEVLFQKKPRAKKLPNELRILQDQLAERLSTKVSIKRTGEKGKLVIEYANEEDLKRIIDAMHGEIY